jgi:hypothetical protein
MPHTSKSREYKRTYSRTIFRVAEAGALLGLNHNGAICGIAEKFDVTAKKVHSAVIWGTARGRCLES